MSCPRISLACLFSFSARSWLPRRPSPDTCSTPTRLPNYMAGQWACPAGAPPTRILSMMYLVPRRVYRLSLCVEWCFWAHVVLPALGRPTIMITSHSSLDLGPAFSGKVHHASSLTDQDNHHGNQSHVCVQTHFWLGQDGPCPPPVWGCSPQGDQRQRPASGDQLANH